jgi:hypothetical protein
MTNFDGMDSFPGVVMLCAPDGIVAHMNAAAVTHYAKDGGRALIGTNILDCHPSPAREKLEELMRDRKTNIYTSEKNGVKRLIYQFPWYQDGEYAGYGEISFEVPLTIPNFVRK